MHGHDGDMSRLHRTAAAGWLASTDPAGLLYGAIVSAAVLATVSAHAEGRVFVGVATALVLVVYWMAHVYIARSPASWTATPGTSCSACAPPRSRDQRPQGRAAGHRRLRRGERAGAEVDTAAAAAVYFTVVLLAAVGYLGAHQAGLTGARAWCSRSPARPPSAY